MTFREVSNTSQGCEGRHRFWRVTKTSSSVRPHVCYRSAVDARELGFGHAVHLGRGLAQGNGLLGPGLVGDQCGIRPADLWRSVQHRQYRTGSARTRLPYGSEPGALNVGWNGGHTAATLPDGTPVSSGEGGGVRVGGGGAFQRQFSHHMSLPLAPEPEMAPPPPPADPFAPPLPPEDPFA